MALHYDKLKHKDESSGSWASYSDLFMVLSVIFLLLYVVASLRNGTFSIQQHLEYQILAQRAEDLQRQIKVYDTLRQDYLQTGASADEALMYDQLMERLDLLQDDSQQEISSLHQQILEQQQKQEALNQYQQMVRNIINSNLIAQSRIQRRDHIIDEKQIEITQLEQDVTQQRQTIAQNNQQIRNINDQLESKIQELQQSQTQHQQSQESLNQQIAKLRTEAEQQIKQLETQNLEATRQLSATSQQLHQASSQLETASRQLELQKQQKAELEGEIENLRAEHDKRASELQAQHQAAMEQARKRFESNLEQQRLSAEARAEREAQFREHMAQRQQQFENKIQGLSQQVEQSEKALQQAKVQHDRYLASIDELKKESEGLQQERASLQQEKAGLSDELKRAQELANARRELAERIQQNFQKAGIDAEVDGRTGDVILSFQDEYFDTDRADLKPGMRQSLRQMMPTYAQSLFANPEIAKKVQAVEVIGFASPTYQGRFVDPRSLNPSDRAAVSYNLDLSYNRAKSIFDYIFDTRQLQYQHQQDLLPLVKVTGRSFLAEEIEGMDLESGISQREFCRQYDCKKSQRVIIKFSLDG